MSETIISLFLVFMWLQGIAVGYVIWAPETAFKKAFVDGLTFKFLRRKKMLNLRMKEFSRPRHYEQKN